MAQTNVELASNLNKSVNDTGNYIQSLLDLIQKQKLELDDLRQLKAAAENAILKLTLATTTVVGV